MATEKPIVYEVPKETLEYWEKQLMGISQPKAFYNEDFGIIKTQIIEDSAYTAKKIIGQIRLITKNSE